MHGKPAGHFTLIAMIRQEWRRPWKLLSLGIGLGLLLIGSILTPAPDWDIAISFIMAGFTYLFAGWSMHVVLERRWSDWPLMLLLTWWCVDGCYALYWSLVNPATLALMRDVNWPASLSLYWMCGLVWYWNGTLAELLRRIRQPREGDREP